MYRTKTSCGRICVLVLMIVSLTFSPLLADTRQHSRTAQDTLKTRITHTWTDAPIDSVLVDLADMAGIDIVKSPKVTGNITAKLTDVPLAEALTNILAAHDFTYVATDNMIRVVPIHEITLAVEQPVSKVYRITYADANEVATALAGFVSDKGSVALNRSTSHIMVTDVEERIRGVDKFVAELDRETPQVVVEVRMYEIRTKEGFELSTDWNVARNVPLKTSQYTESRTETDAPDQITQTVTTSDSGATTRETTTTSGETLQETKTTSGGQTEQITVGSQKDYLNPGQWDDQTRSSVTTSTNPTTESTTKTTNPTTETVTETTDPTTQTVTSVTDTGAETFRNTKNETYTKRTRKPFVGGGYDTLTGGNLTFSLLNDAVDLQFALNVLQTEVEAQLLANPTILVLDNETANFEITREVPYRELLQVAREDPITYTDFKQIGVLLEVTPHITRDGKLRLHVIPEFSTLVRQDLSGLPTIDKRRADTKALIMDGQTIAIGGLRQKEISKGVSKVPVLGDLPLLGGLFRSETESEEISELLVFITSRIISQPESYATEPVGSIEMPNLFGQKKQEQEPKVEQEAPTTSAMPDQTAVTPVETIDNSSPEAMTHLAYAHLKSGHYDVAADLLGSVVETQPDNAQAHRYLGYCQLKLERIDAAAESYEKAVDLAPDDWEAQRSLGVAYILQAKSTGDDELRARALERWQMSLSINPDQPKADQLQKLIDSYSTDAE